MALLPKNCTGPNRADLYHGLHRSIGSHGSNNQPAGRTKKKKKKFRAYLRVESIDNIGSPLYIYSVPERLVFVQCPCNLYRYIDYCLLISPRIGLVRIRTLSHFIFDALSTELSGALRKERKLSIL